VRFPQAVSGRKLRSLLSKSQRKRKRLLFIRPNLRLFLQPKFSLLKPRKRKKSRKQ
jgi:hypothetical protein